MPDTITTEILTKCLEIDQKAHSIYQQFSALAKNQELSDFWARLGDEEKTHCSYWKKLITLAKNGLLPGLIDQGNKLKEEMEEMIKKVERTILKSKGKMDENTMLLLTYWLEFYFMHPSIMNFLNFLEKGTGEQSPATNYKNHMENFIRVLDKFGKNKPEIELLAETVKRLWWDSSKMVEMSNTDFLTGLLNRRGLFDAFQPFLYLARRKMLSIGVMIIDVDDFKNINDQYGHKAGDQALIWLANLLKDNLRLSDVIGRYGGDEFFIYLSDVDLNYLLDVAVKLRKLVETQSQTEVPFTISIGVTGGMVGPDIEGDLQAMIKRADDNLLRAKKAGKNSVRIDASVQYRE